VERMREDKVQFRIIRSNNATFVYLKSQENHLLSANRSNDYRSYLVLSNKDTLNCEECVTSVNDV
jgi:hypothetical protein